MSSTGPQDTTRPDWEDNLLDYLFGALPPDEAVRFEQSLLECQEHVALAQRYRQVIGTLGTVVRPEEPPTGHKERFMARLEATPQQQPSPVLAGDEDTSTRAPGLAAVVGSPIMRETRGPALLAPREVPSDGVGKPAVVDIAAARRERARSSWAVAAASVAAVVALLLGVWAFMLNSRAGSPNIPPGYQLLAVQPQGVYTSTAVALFNPDTQEAYLYANGLQPLPVGKVYELWLLPPAGDPVAAGIFTGDSAGRATHRHTASRPLREYTGFAVTIEDAPGVSAPEGPVVMVGQYQ